ncbi:MAG: signal peptide peptidase SppA [Deltaproteobacteria bacterium]|nr:signal peptide peptidase SppA [Deltaproteobacteria bacterium]
MIKPAILLAAAMIPSLASAQQNFVPRDVTRGVVTPDGNNVAGDFDATAVASNPAGLGALGAFELDFAATAIDEDGVVGGGGWGLFIGLPLRLPFPGPSPFSITYGFAFQSVNSPDTWTGLSAGADDQDGSYLLNSIGLGTPRLSIGWTVGNFFWTNTPQVDSSVVTHHVGLQARPFDWLAFGATIRDVFEPVGRVAEEKLERSWDLELAVRPLGDWRLEVAGTARLGEDERYDFGGRVGARLYSGLSLFGSYQAVGRDFGDPGAGKSYDHRLSLGLRVDLGLSGSYAAIASNESDQSVVGHSVMVRYSAQRRPTITSTKRAVKVSWSRPASSDRKFVARVWRLAELATDDEVRGVVIDLGAAVGGYGRAAEIHQAIARLRKTGKKVVAYLRVSDQASYYAVSGADRLYLHPTTSLNLTGVAAGTIHLRDMLAKLGIQAEAVRIAEYKAAPEALIRQSSTEPARRQLRAYIEDVDSHVIAAIAAGRKIDQAALEALKAHSVVTPRQALKAKLVDGFAHPDQLGKLATRDLGGLAIGSVRGAEADSRWVYPRIAVIYVEGTISPGEPAPSLFGQTPTGPVIARAIAKARSNPEVDAVVIRVSSPGGEVQASELIAREVELTRGKKPVVVSMGDVAASGGYMASAWGDVVYASPTTLTGSIGIFALKLNARDLLPRIGVAVETHRSGEHADQNSLVRPWTEDERRGTAKQMLQLYERFVAMVAKGRKLPLARVGNLARGRVYSGAAAHAVGLIDHRGGVADAIAEARRRAKLGGTEIRLLHLPRVERSLAEILGGPSAGQGGVIAGLAPRMAGLLRVLWPARGGQTLYAALLPYFEP